MGDVLGKDENPEKPESVLTENLNPNQEKDTPEKSGDHYIQEVMRESAFRLRKKTVWKICAKVSDGCYLMSKNVGGRIRYAPLGVVYLHYVRAKRQMEVERLLKQYRCYEDIEDIHDRMRWCRHMKGLEQQDVAAMVGITQQAYMRYENGRVDLYEKEVVDRLAAVYGITPNDLLDDFTRFCYDGQGKRIRKYRESLGLDQRAFAKMLGVDNCDVREWEEEKRRILRGTWEKYFNGRA